MANYQDLGLQIAIITWMLDSYCLPISERKQLTWWYMSRPVKKTVPFFGVLALNTQICSSNWTSWFFFHCHWCMNMHKEKVLRCFKSRLFFCLNAALALVALKHCIVWPVFWVLFLFCSVLLLSRSSQTPNRLWLPSNHQEALTDGE